MKASIHPIRLPIFVLVAILVLAAPAFAAGQENTGKDTGTLTADHPWIGEPAPNFALTSTGGQSVALSDFKGLKFLVIHFAASW